MKIELENITSENFTPFGDVLEFPPYVSSDFHIFVREYNDPWRLALLRFSRHSVEKMENHPESRESFEPLEGSAVLFVAEHEHPEKIHAFFLDKPICLYKGIWHDVLALSANAKVKITENLKVTSEYHYLEKPLRIFAED